MAKTQDKNRNTEARKKAARQAKINYVNNDTLMEPIITKRVINHMARRYELAYTKLYSELPVWKQQSFIKVIRSDDTIYNEFIASVIALAENETKEILLTA